MKMGGGLIHEREHISELCLQLVKKKIVLMYIHAGHGN